MCRYYTYNRHKIAQHHFVFSTFILTSSSRSPSLSVSSMETPDSTQNAGATARKHASSEATTPVANFHLSPGLLSAIPPESTASTQIKKSASVSVLLPMVQSGEGRGPRMCKVREIINADSMIEKFKVNNNGWPDHLATPEGRLHHLNVQIRGSLRKRIVKNHGKLYYANMSGEYYGIYANDDPAVRNPDYRLFISGKRKEINGHKVDWNLYVYAYIYTCFLFLY